MLPLAFPGQVADVSGRLNFTAAELANSPYLQALPPGETILLPISNDAANELQQDQQQLVQQQQPELPPATAPHPQGATKKAKKAVAAAGKATKDAVAAAWDQNEIFADAEHVAGGQYPAVYQQPAGTAEVAGAASVVDLDTETDSNHDTALTLACAGGHEELVKLLLERGAAIGELCTTGYFLFRTQMKLVSYMILKSSNFHEIVVSFHNIYIISNYNDTIDVKQTWYDNSFRLNSLHCHFLPPQNTETRRDSRH